MLKIITTSIHVNDPREALEFYRDTLGFETRVEQDLGEAWYVTVASPADSHEVHLLLEPSDHPAATAYMKALHDDGIPAMEFGVDDVHAEYERLQEAGVEFTQPPTEGEGGQVNAIFDDTCGNFVMIREHSA